MFAAASLPASARAQAPPGATPVTMPVTIDQAVREALDHNLALLAERYNVSVADAAVVTARLRPNPVVTLNVMRPDQGLVDAGISPNEQVFRTDYLVERGGKRDRRVDAATSARSVVDAQLLNTTRTLVLDVQNAFTDLQLDTLNLALAQENLAAFNNVVQVNQERVRAGDLSQVELGRSRLAALQFENDVQQQTAKLRVAQTRLSTLMGRGPDGRSLTAAGELRREGTVPEADVLLARALEKRPDLAAARLDVARSAADLRLQLAVGAVDYTISGEYHRQDGTLIHGNSYGAFVSAPLPIFNRNQGEVARARAQQTQLETRVRAVEADVASDVATAMAQYTSARRIVERIEAEMLATARDVRETTEYSYRAGDASFVELLDAVRAFNDTMQSYNEARADYARSLYALDAAIGAATP